MLRGDRGDLERGSAADVGSGDRFKDKVGRREIRAVQCHRHRQGGFTVTHKIFHPHRIGSRGFVPIILHIIRIGRSIFSIVQSKLVEIRGYTGSHWGAAGGVHCECSITTRARLLSQGGYRYRDTRIHGDSTLDGVLAATRDIASALVGSGDNGISVRGCLGDVIRGGTADDAVGHCHAGGKALGFKSGISRVHRDRRDGVALANGTVAQIPSFSKGDGGIGQYCNLKGTFCLLTSWDALIFYSVGNGF